MEVQAQHEESKGKSEVMVIGGGGGAHTWMLEGKQIGETECYKYLGVEIPAAMIFRRYKERILAKARRSMGMVWGMGMREGMLPVEDGVRVWKALVRSVLEYGAEVWGGAEWEEAERLQRQMAKRILNCSEYTVNEVALGSWGGGD